MSVTNLNLLVNTNFKFLISNLPTTEFFCTAVTFPTLNVSSVQMWSPQGAVNTPAAGLNYSELSLDFLIDEDMTNYFELVDWIKAVSTPYTGRAQSLYDELGYDPYSDLSLILLDNNMNPLKTIVFVNAFPTNLGAIAFDSSVDVPIVQKCNVSFAFDHYQLAGVNDYK